VSIFLLLDQKQEPNILGNKFKKPERGGDNSRQLARRAKPQSPNSHHVIDCKDAAVRRSKGGVAKKKLPRAVMYLRVRSSKESVYKMRNSLILQKRKLVKQ
tara:strand:+ start:1551 stop:1853 length:303 start_codon:yes stop_codon:yes gene_type:complete